MSKVTVFLNGREFTIGCEEGQEAYLKSLASYLDGKVQGITEQVGQIGDLRLLLMASLVVVDELKDAERRIETLEAHVDQLRSRSAGENVHNEQQRDQLARTITALAERMESLADRLDGKPDEDAAGQTPLEQVEA
ncbi:MAG: cell division protein ZapA [Maricaulis sp.]|uniref:cell division protein ZapA n=1 Tax=Maricaulis sp. TaxID=1486257 RepID=UPI001B2F762B|nr:cell division protein ZapA [Maricaulis sp.]MBO6729842.1 cell division protein ZapA [Maricaulis sp.]MBO6848072.1 cell division protein ZapA [Maricaulis sp.]MBO6877854.1 cell division protein ZapA [Maricaulis sp.]MDM7984922.1 cell division protein ZapA [Maricaulis sp.]